MRIERFEAGPFAQNSWLAICAESRGAVLVDAGAGSGAAVALCEREGLELHAVLLTHAHLDHVDGLGAVRAALPEIPVHLHPLDLPLWQAAGQQAAMFGMPAPRLPEDPVLDLGEREELDFGGDLRFRVRFAPGHAPGHVLFVQVDEGVAFVGDVVFAGSIGRTDLPGGSLDTLMASIRDQVLTLPEATRLLPGHGPETTVARERASNPFLVSGRSGFA